MLSRRALNRATLARQLLLDRAPLSAHDAITRLGGLNGQNAVEPYVSLWTRLTAFTPDDLTTLLRDRTVVRGSLLRGTQHYVTADDYVVWRPVLHAVLERMRKGAHGRQTAGVDLDELAAAARVTLRDHGGAGLTRPELGRLLAPRWPGADPLGLARSLQALLPIVHPPTVSTWDKRGGATPFVLADDWLGRPLAESTAPEPVVLRHLAAFGPASVADVQAWSGLTRLREVVEAMAPRLRVHADEHGVPLYDVPDAPLPDPDTPAPVRLVPALDNLLVSFRDRTRVLRDDHRPLVCVGAEIKAVVLVDGDVVATWHVDRDREAATLVVAALPGTAWPLDEDAIGPEALATLGFVCPGHTRDIEFRPPP